MSYQELIKELSFARNVVAITGAGVSAESGIKTFRGNEGYWDSLDVEKISTPNGFYSAPEAGWSFYNNRRKELSDKKPNTGHYALAELESMFSSFTVITQNVDELHQAAGSKNVIEIHGRLMETKCKSSGKVWRSDHNQSLKCKCGSTARPNVVWFGETYDRDLYKRCVDACGLADVILICGTSGMVGLVECLTWSLHLTYEAEFNLEQCFQNVDAFVEGKSGDTLPKLVKDLKAFKND